jgi:hypothetical protein
MDPDQEKLLKEEEERKKKMSKIARIKCIFLLKKRYGRKRNDTKKIIYIFWKINFI